MSYEIVSQVIAYCKRWILPTSTRQTRGVTWDLPSPTDIVTKVGTVVAVIWHAIIESTAPISVDNMQFRLVSNRALFPRLGATCKESSTNVTWPCHTPVLSTHSILRQ
jgi:hypothetical protein